MTHKTAALERLDAVLIDILSYVALGAVVHLHAVPGIAFDARYVPAPNITTDAGNSIFLIDREALRFADMAVTGNTVHLGFDHMGGMGEKDTVLLPGVDEPGHFPSLRNIFFHKAGLVLGFAHGFLVAIDTIGQLGDTCIGAVFPEIMAAFTAIIDLSHVERMVKIDRLLFL
jgi:hypothetical protein